jgi:hypothetical protein
MARQHTEVLLKLRPRQHTEVLLKLRPRQHTEVLLKLRARQHTEVLLKLRPRQHTEVLLCRCAAVFPVVPGEHTSDGQPEAACARIHTDGDNLGRRCWITFCGSSIYSSNTFEGKLRGSCVVRVNRDSVQGNLYIH